jgi:hypothetical protein
MSGLDLKVERTRRRVKAKRLAAVMGVSASRVTAIEREQFPSNEIVERYRSALDTCAPSATPTAAA